MLRMCRNTKGVSFNGQSSHLIYLQVLPCPQGALSHFDYVDFNFNYRQMQAEYQQAYAGSIAEELDLTIRHIFPHPIDTFLSKRIDSKLIETSALKRLIISGYRHFEDLARSSLSWKDSERVAVQLRCIKIIRDQVFRHTIQLIMSPMKSKGFYFSFHALLDKNVKQDEH